MSLAELKCEIPSRSLDVSDIATTQSSRILGARALATIAIEDQIMAARRLVQARQGDGQQTDEIALEDILVGLQGIGVHRILFTQYSQFPPPKKVDRNLIHPELLAANGINMDFEGFSAELTRQVANTLELNPNQRRKLFSTVSPPRQRKP